jgi:hypothetical protein
MSNTKINSIPENNTSSLPTIESKVFLPENPSLRSVSKLESLSQEPNKLAEYHFKLRTKRAKSKLDLLTEKMQKNIARAPTEFVIPF